MKKTLPSLRVSEETLEQMSQAIKKFNENSIVKLSGQEFRRLSYEFFSQIVLQNKQDQLKKLLQLQ